MKQMTTHVEALRGRHRDGGSIPPGSILDRVLSGNDRARLFLPLPTRSFLSRAVASGVGLAIAELWMIS